jgi:hypothetical protein
MDIPEDKVESVRWFLETMCELRDELTTEEFQSLRDWIEFIASEPRVVH